VIRRIPVLAAHGLRSKQGEFEQKEAKVSKGDWQVGFGGVYARFVVFPFRGSGSKISESLCYFCSNPLFPFL
jgi:hypothetical protein